MKAHVDVYDRSVLRISFSLQKTSNERSAYQMLKNTKMFPPMSSTEILIVDVSVPLWVEVRKLLQRPNQLVFLYGLIFLLKLQAVPAKRSPVAFLFPLAA